VVETTAGAFGAKYVINCAGLHSDRVSRMAGADIALKIVPFRGEYHEIVPEKHHLVNGLVYPVADPRFPFLGVHFTRRIHGGVEAGPNAVLAFKREGYGKADVNLTDTLETLSYPGFWRMTRKYWRSGMGEFYRSFSKPAFVRALQKLLPELTETDITPGGAGVRAQALDRDGRLVDDFRFIHTERMVHVCNVPSPAATASIAIGQQIVQELAAAYELTTAAIQQVD
jgi:L-2-hydroxyglutarate oxidase LhgO